MDIPDFTISGVLPPYLGPSPIVPAAMSPYPSSLVKIAGKMCASDLRKELLRGLLTYRQRLGAIGLEVGFQWLSGSFLEDIEALEARGPRDVDVVTFCHRPPAAMNDPDWLSLINANVDLFDPPQVKAAFKCDAYFVDMDVVTDSVVSQAKYWFGLFSHRRGGLWKGMLEIPLAITADDADAAVLVTP